MMHRWPGEEQRGYPGPGHSMGKGAEARKGEMQGGTWCEWQETSWKVDSHRVRD